jgi:hypothetical protein
MSLDRQVRNDSNPAPEEVQDRHSRIPPYACLLNTKCKVQVACAHRDHPHVLTASSSAQRLVKSNNASAASQLATPLRARSLLSETRNYL